MSHLPSYLMARVIWINHNDLTFVENRTMGFGDMHNDAPLHSEPLTVLKTRNATSQQTTIVYLASRNNATANTHSRLPALPVQQQATDDEQPARSLALPVQQQATDDEQPDCSSTQPVQQQATDVEQPTFRSCGRPATAAAVATIPTDTPPPAATSLPAIAA